MGWNASTEKKKKQEVPIRKKSTLRRPNSERAPAQGTAPPPAQSPVVQESPPKSPGETKQPAKEAKPKVVRAENGAEEHTKDAEKPKGTLEAKEPGTAEPMQEVIVSNTYNKEKIEDIVASFKDMDDKKIIGNITKNVLLFGKDYYPTKDWSLMQFAIYNKQIRAVRYFIEYKKVNRRLSTKKRSLKRDETTVDAEVFPLILAIHNQDDSMLDYLWSMNELWDYEHLKVVLQTIFSRTFWWKGVEILLGSEATQDIYNALSYSEKKQFIVELFYRYLLQSNEDIKKTIRKRSVQRPYSLVAMHFLMNEAEAANIPLIKEACDNITVEDYGKMKYESGKEFMTSWLETLTKFEKLEGEFPKISRSVDR